MHSTPRFPASCSSSCTPRSRTCCSTASCGSCATPTSRRAWPKSSSTIAPASRPLQEDAEQALSARARELAKAGVPEDLARRIANLRALAAAPDIVSVADRTSREVADVAATYFAAGAFFQLDRIVNAA